MLTQFLNMPPLAQFCVVSAMMGAAASVPVAFEWIGRFGKWLDS